MLQGGRRYGSAYVVVGQIATIRSVRLCKRAMTPFEKTSLGWIVLDGGRGKEQESARWTTMCVMCVVLCSAEDGREQVKKRVLAEKADQAL